MLNLTYRVLPPSSAAASPLTTHGRTYPASAAYVDVPAGDALQLAANGWTIVGRVGTSAQRPSTAITEAHAVKPGERFVDTTLGKLIVFDGVTWRDAVTGGVV